MGKDAENEKDLCRKCGGEIAQRPDDTVAGVKTRLQIFREETLPVVEYFKQKGVVVEINGVQPAEKVFADIVPASRT